MWLEKLQTKCLQANNLSFSECKKIINQQDQNTQLDMLKKFPGLIKYIKNISDALAIDILNYGHPINLKYIPLNTPEIRLEIMRRVGWQKFIKNPTEEEQITAVCRHPASIQYIKNPSKEVQLKAISGGNCCSEWYEKMLKYIKNPCQEVKTKTLKRGCSLKLIKNQTQEDITTAINYDYDSNNYKYIKHKSKELDSILLNINSCIFKFIKKPTDEQKWIALKRNSDAIMYIKNPTKKMQEFAVSQDINNILYINKPYPEVIKIAVDFNPYFILNIKNNLNSELVLIAIEKSKFDKKLISFAISKKYISEETAEFLFNSLLIKEIIE